MKYARWLGLLGLAALLGVLGWSPQEAGSQESSPRERGGKKAAAVAVADKAKEPAGKADHKREDQQAVDAAVIDLLIQILKDPNSGNHRQYRACDALAKRGAKAKKALPALMNFLEEKLPTVDNDEQMAGLRWRILPAIESLGGDREKVFELVYSRLREATSGRSCLITCLASIASRCPRAEKIKATALFQVISETEDGYERNAARMALVIMGNNCLAELQVSNVSTDEQAVKVPWPIQSAESFRWSDYPDMAVTVEGDSVIVKHSAWTYSGGTHYVIVTGADGRSGFIKIKT